MAVHEQFFVRPTLKVRQYYKFEWSTVRLFGLNGQRWMKLSTSSLELASNDFMRRILLLAVEGFWCSGIMKIWFGPRHPSSRTVLLTTCFKSSRSLPFLLSCSLDAKSPSLEEKPTVSRNTLTYIWSILVMVSKISMKWIDLDSIMGLWLSSSNNFSMSVPLISQPLKCFHSIVVEPSDCINNPEARRDWIGSPSLHPAAFLYLLAPSLKWYFYAILSPSVCKAAEKLDQLIQSPLSSCYTVGMIGAVCFVAQSVLSCVSLFNKKII